MGGKEPWLNMFLGLLLATVSSVHGHGGMVWPPIWQDGVGLDIEEVFSLEIKSDPVVVDPKTGIRIDNVKSWGTDQTYTGGHGNDNYTYGAPHHGEGPHTDFVDCNEEMDGDSWTCAKWKHPWAAPGRAPLYGGGCGIHGLNPFGNRTYWREVGPEHRNDGWQWEDKTDVTEGTYPEGSAWRKESPIGWDDGIWNDRIYKDFVRIPCDLKPGQYVLSWRWDAMTAPQIWSSCANIEIV